MFRVSGFKGRGGFGSGCAAPGYVGVDHGGFDVFMNFGNSHFFGVTLVVREDIFTNRVDVGFFCAGEYCLTRSASRYWSRSFFPLGGVGDWGVCAIWLPLNGGRRIMRQIVCYTESGGITPRTGVFYDKLWLNT